jgi:hypothetical protein
MVQAVTPDVQPDALPELADDAQFSAKDPINRAHPARREPSVSEPQAAHATGLQTHATARPAWQQQHVGAV